MPATSRRPHSVLAALLLTTFLAACQSADDRAEGHFQSALELLGEGDVDRAVVEFRNTFQDNPRHKEARLAFARVLMDAGDFAGAFQNYLLVSEQFPDDAAPRIELSEMAILSRNWEALRRHAPVAIEQSPSDPRVKIIDAMLRYVQAVDDNDDPARREAALELVDLRDNVEERLVANQGILDSYLRDGEFRKALAEIDNILADNETNEGVQVLKLQVLSRLQDEEGIREQLNTLARLFPENRAYASSLIQWHVSRGETDDAEAIIRGNIETSDQPDIERALLVSFLREIRGPEAALEETLKQVEEAESPVTFRSLAAVLKFEMGEQDLAISEMETILESAETSDQINGIKVALARMHVTNGNEVAARQRVEEVLAEDAGNVDALKLRSNWLIEEDKADEAIVALRTALDQAPNDPQIMSLMAQAHLRNGSRGLAGEMLALAVEASGSAAPQTIEYVRFLLADDNLTTAESVLIDALRVVPGNRDLLVALAEVYVRQKDWPRAEQVEATLRRQDEPESIRQANSLRLNILRGQQRGDDAVTFLEGLVNQSDGDIRAIVSLVRTRAANGDVEGAESYVRSLLEENPENVTYRLMLAAFLQQKQDYAQASEILTGIVEENPNLVNVWRSLHVLHLREGVEGRADETLAKALEANPEDANLLWTRAGVLEREGKIDDAIAIYEDLYERLPDAPIVANNLASLIGTYKEDPALIERAWAISRRLRGAEVPAFQDTYGWIALRRGNLDEALEHLEPAAEGLQDDPVVQYHLAVAYTEAERYEEAIRQFRKALDVAGPADTRPQFAKARAEIERIETLLAEQDSN